jgi:hypothetical protein
MAMWGYDQTNVDYYEVIRPIGKCSVEIREIGVLREETGWLQGNCTPCKGHYKGEPMVRRVLDGKSVKVRSWGVWAHKKESRMVSGVEIFQPDYWTAYA